MVLLSRRSLRRAALWASPVVLGACIFGYRAERTFTGSTSLSGIQSIRLNFPETPITVAGDAGTSSLRWNGTWFVLAGGSTSNAEEQAVKPKVEFDSTNTFGELRAVVPLELFGQVSLEMGDITMPADRDLDVVTEGGDVDISGVTAKVYVDVDWGAVSVSGGLDSISVSTGEGDVTATTAGVLDLYTGRGDVTAEQAEPMTDVYILTYGGDVTLTIASDENLDLHVDAAGRITVETDNIATVTAGYLVRHLGDADVPVYITAVGDVTIEQAPASE